MQILYLKILTTFSMNLTAAKFDVDGVKLTFTTATGCKCQLVCNRIQNNIKVVLIQLDNKLGRSLAKFSKNLSNMNIQEFNRIERTAQYGEFDAIEYAIGMINMLPNVEEVTVNAGKHDYAFAINDENRTALYKQIVLRNARTSDTFLNDVNRRTVTISIAIRAIRAFYVRYNGYKLAIPVSNEDRDTCVFVHKVGRTYNFVCYIPGDGRIGILDNFLRALSLTFYNTSRAYTTKDSRGRCAVLTWTQIYDFLANTNDPFNRDDYIYYNTSERRFK